MKPYTTKLRCFYFWRPETGSAGDFTHSLPGSCAIKFNMAGNVQFLDLTPSKQQISRHLGTHFGGGGSVQEFTIYLHWAMHRQGRNLGSALGGGM